MFSLRIYKKLWYVWQENLEVNGFGEIAEYAFSLSIKIFILLKRKSNFKKNIINDIEIFTFTSK
jgi:hypothetical protein